MAVSGRRYMLSVLSSVALARAWAVCGPEGSMRGRRERERGARPRAGARARGFFQSVVIVSFSLVPSEMCAFSLSRVRCVCGCCARSARFVGLPVFCRKPVLEENTKLIEKKKKLRHPLFSVVSYRSYRPYGAWPRPLRLPSNAALRLSFLKWHS